MHVLQTTWRRAPQSERRLKIYFILSDNYSSPFAQLRNVNYERRQPSSSQDPLNPTESAVASLTWCKASLVELFRTCNCNNEQRHNIWRTDGGRNGCHALQAVSTHQQTTTIHQFHPPCMPFFLTGEEHYRELTTLHTPRKWGADDRIWGKNHSWSSSCWELVVGVRTPSWVSPQSCVHQLWFSTVHESRSPLPPPASLLPALRPLAHSVANVASSPVVLPPTLFFLGALTGTCSQCLGLCSAIRFFKDFTLSS